MNLETPDFTTVVTLSKRNLLELLDHLDGESIVRLTPGGLLVVRSESDAVHYRERVPGMPIPKGHRVVAERAS